MHTISQVSSLISFSTIIKGDWGNRQIGSTRDKGASESSRYQGGSIGEKQGEGKGATRRQS